MKVAWASAGVTGWVAIGWGGETPRVRHHANATMMRKHVLRMRMAPCETPMTEAFGAAAARLSWLREALPRPTASSWPRAPSAIVPGSRMQTCQFGCNLQVGCTFRTYTTPGRRAVGRPAGSALQKRTMLDMRVPLGDKLVGEPRRLGRGQRRRPGATRRASLALATQLEGPLSGLGCAAAAPELAAATVPSRGSTRRTRTCGTHSRRTRSAWPRNGRWQTKGEARRPPLSASTQFEGESPTGSARGNVTGKDTPLRPCPKRVLRRLWSALLGELNSVTKSTYRAHAREFTTTQLAEAAAEAWTRESCRAALCLTARMTLALAREGPPCRQTLRTRQAGWRGTMSRY